MFRTQYEDIRLDTGTLQFLYGVLGGLGLQFTGSSQVGDISCLLYTSDAADE